MVVSTAASSSELFIAKNIYVDVTERNSEIARRHALSQGQAVAFRKIMERIVDEKDLAFLPEFSPEEIAYLLKEVSVVKESTSPVRYIATLNVSFDEDKIKQILTEMGMAFVLSPSKPYLLLPFYEANNSLIIYGANPWQRVWKKTPPETALVPIMLPNYDNRDRELIKSASPTRDQLVKLSDIYGTEGVIIAEAIKVDSTELKLNYRKYLNGYITERYVRAFDIEDGNEQAALRKMAEYIASRGDAGWRKKMAVDVSEPNLLVVVVPLQSLEHLNKIRDRITKIPLIANFELKAVKQDRAQINIWHSTDMKALESAFRNQKMKLVKVDDFVYGVEDLIPPPKKPKPKPVPVIEKVAPSVPKTVTEEITDKISENITAPNTTVTIEETETRIEN